MNACNQTSAQPRQIRPRVLPGTAFDRGPESFYIVDMMETAAKNLGNMSPEDYEIAMKLRDGDPEFRELWEAHLDLKRQLKELESRPHLSADEEREVKKIKRQKLSGKDKLALKINEYKVGVVPPR